jgi:hypothetical protein
MDVRRLLVRVTIALVPVVILTWCLLVGTAGTAGSLSSQLVDGTRAQLSSGLGVVAGRPTPPIRPAAPAGPPPPQRPMPVQAW